MKHGMIMRLLAGWMVLGGAVSVADVQLDGHTPGRWTMDLDAARGYAKDNGRAIFMAFSGSDWCYWCRLMDRQVFQKDAWREYAKANLVLVMVDFPRNKALVPGKYVQRNDGLRNEYDVRGYPTYVLLDGKTGAETARFGAGRDKTPESMIAEVKAVLGDADAADAPPARSVDPRQEEVIVRALREFGSAAAEDKKQVAAATLATLSETLGKDPVLLVLLEPRALIEMVPCLNLPDLKILAQHLDKAREAGTPIDEFQAELARLATARHDDLSTIRGLMFLYNVLGERAKGLALLPEIEVLKQVDTPQQAKELIEVLKGVGKSDTALALAFHMQRTVESEQDRKAFCMDILEMADQADDTFLTDWLAAVSGDRALVEALRGELGKQAAKAGAMVNANARVRLLKGHVRIVNMLGQTAPSKGLSRQYLRHWQFEFANSLSRYRGPAEPPPRTSRPPKPPPFVPFTALLDCRLSPECVATLPEAEAELHTFQIIVARLKSGQFDERALQELTAFNGRYPTSVATHCAAFVEDWGKEVNPNQQPSRNTRRTTGQAVGIPLTRARQERNLTECSRIFEIIRDVGVGLSDDVMLAGFMACFSRAEIVSRDAVLRVFPDVSSLSDEFIVKLAANVIRDMRANWMNAENRQKLQQEYGTNRTDSDMDNETARAYRGMIDLITERLEISQDSIPLRTMLAALSFDLAEFSKAVGLTTLEEYTELRDSTFRMFEECYNIYQEGLPEMSEDQYSVDYLKYWFSAVFGASDLSALDVNLNENPSQLERVQATLDAMEEPYRDIHKTLFGKWIVSQWGGLKPHVKLTVLQSTLEVLGNHHSVAMLVTRMEDYDELLSEVELIAEVDGSTNVGFNRLFGVTLKLRHTDALEREAGGFSRYVRNQVPPFPGSRDKVDYRNRFAENIGKALKDQFEVAGITWMDAAVRSVGTPTPHWRETPLAYVSMKALDATVDRVPSIQLDMDFRDQSGLVVLPVLSNIVIIDTGDGNPPPRPVDKVEVRLILDARRAAKGEVKLEVAMKGEGILPGAESLLRPASGYSFGPIVDAGNLVLKLEQRGGGLVAHTEQNATFPIEWAGPPRDGEFTFPEVSLKGAKVVYEQYRDADIIPAGRTVALDDVRSWAWIFRLWPVPVVGIPLVAILVVIIVRRKQGTEEISAPEFVLPAEVNGISVLSMLERMRRSGRLNAQEDRDALAADVRSIEEACFSVDKKRDVDLASIAVKWLERVT